MARRLRNYDDSGSSLFDLKLTGPRGWLTGTSKEGLNNSQFNLMTPLGSITVAGLAGAAAGYIPATGMYLVGDFFFLLISATVLLRLVLMLDESTRNQNSN